MFFRTFPFILAAFLSSLPPALASDEDKDEGLSLLECVTFATDNNYDIKKAKERLNKQYHVKLEARAGFYPALGVGGELTYTEDDRIEELNGQKFGSEEYWTVNVRAEQNIVAGGRDLASSRRGKFLEDAAKEELETVIEDVLFRVRQAYYGVLLAEAQVEVQRQNVELFQEQLRTEKNRLEAGMVSDYNVLRAEVDLANSQTPFIRARNQVKLSWEELRRVLGIGDIRDGGAIPHKLTGVLRFNEHTVALDDAVKRAEDQRPELRRNKLVIEAEEQGVKIERAEYFPKLGAYVGYGADKTRFTDDFSDENHGWMAGASANWNLFDGLRTTSRVNQAESTLAQARIEYAQLRQDIGVEVRRIHSSFIEAAELVRASSKVVESAEEAHRLSKTRYDSGAATYLDLLDAQVSLTQARTNQIQALHDYNLAWAALKKSMGEIASSEE